MTARKWIKHKVSEIEWNRKQFRGLFGRLGSSGMWVEVKIQVSERANEACGLEAARKNYCGAQAQGLA
jgi:hypothetical protein